MIGNRRTDSELIALLDAQGTWVVRGFSGAVGNAGSLRVALHIAQKKSQASNPLKVARYHRISDLLAREANRSNRSPHQGFRALTCLS